MIEFVSYDGSFPNLCSGTLVLKVHGVQRELKYILRSSGSWHFDERGFAILNYGPWYLRRLPDDLLSYYEEIETLVNNNIPYGCCGGCS